MGTYVYKDSQNIYVVNEVDTYSEAQKSVEQFRERTGRGEGKLDHVVSTSNQAQVLGINKESL
jgi:hypothetical protein